MTNSLFWTKIARAGIRKTDAIIGRLYSIGPTLDAMAMRPFELHLELTNLCNANCVFCPYQYQTRKHDTMPDAIFEKAVGDYVACGGGSVGLTPIVGDALIDPKFIARVRYLRAIPQIDHIWLTTNAILLDKYGVNEVLDSGLTSITISTAGFDEAMYRRVYRNASYQRMRSNVLSLLEANSRRANPLAITIALRPDRPLVEVMKDPDFQPILAFNPVLDFTWAFTPANGRIKREDLPPLMRLRSVSAKPETCVQMYNGPIVLTDGTVQACSCVASIDAGGDLGIGNIQDDTLLNLWQGERLRKLRKDFETKSLNPTCTGCDMYRGLDLYRSRDGRKRAQANLARAHGDIVKRSRSKGPFQGG